MLARLPRGVGNGMDRLASPVRLADPIGSVLRRKGGQILSVTPEDSVYEAIDRMNDRHVGALLVISQNKLVGVISERDYARKVILQGKSSKQTPVGEIMTRTVVSVRLDVT